MTRKLLPYEYELIAALGVSKEEYLEFLAVQRQYEDIKTGTELDIRNAETVAIVLTVVGILFQVAAALLAPRPQLPDTTGRAQTREQRTAPRFGFNTVQELAKYGDPIPLVYTNTTDNPLGGVRVAGQLLWSAVQSLGTKQFAQLLLLLASGQVTRINAQKCAFGQTPVRDLIGTNSWIYFAPNTTGTLQFANTQLGDPLSDPTYTSPTAFPYQFRPSLASSTYVSGYSHAYTPSTSNQAGIYSAVPINVVFIARNSKGNKREDELGITVDGLDNIWDVNTYLQSFGQNAAFQLTIKSTVNNLGQDGPAKNAAANARRSYASVFDESGLFKLGSGRFRVTKVTGTSTDEGDVTVTLERTDSTEGVVYSPGVPYAAQRLSDISTEVQRELEEQESATYTRLSKIVDTLLEEDDRNASPKANPITNPEVTSSGYRQITTAQELLESGQVWQIVTKNVNTGSVIVSVFDKWKKRDLTENEKASLQAFIDLETLSNIATPDNIFFTKAMVRYEIAKYETMQQCSAVDLGLKATVFRRISGRASRYGSGNKKGWSESDNGIKNRTCLFLMRYRKNTGAWQYIPGIFVIRRGSQSENYINLRFNAWRNAPANWSFQIEPVVDPIAEAASHPEVRVDGLIRYIYLENSSTAAAIDLPQDTSVEFYGYTETSTTNYPSNVASPKQTNEWDVFSNSADTQYQLSMDDGPEITLLCVTEHIREDRTAAVYKDMSLLGFNLYSSKGLQDLRSFTAFVEQGRPVRRLYTRRQNTANPYYPAVPDGPSSYAPDIFLDTVLDTVSGIGNYVSVDALDLDGLIIAKNFCVKNKLFFDGVIADQTSWREFWSTVAPYSLLEFGRKNGRETLLPAVPYDNEYNITTAVKINALFNQGNILEDSYKEEFIDFGSNTQDLIATVLYRSADADGIFAINKSVEIKRKDASVDAVRQNFDLSAYVTSRDQAILYGKLLCNIRRFVRSAIEFKTFPTTSPLEPGAFIYVDVGQNVWDQIRTGVIGPSNTLNTPVDSTVINGAYTILLYKSGQGVVTRTIIVVNNVVIGLDNKYEGYLFVIGNRIRRKRVFRVTEISMDEEGEVTVRATSYPCRVDGTAEIPDFSSSLFDIQG